MPSRDEKVEAYEQLALSLVVRVLAESLRYVITMHREGGAVEESLLNEGRGQDEEIKMKLFRDNWLFDEWFEAYYETFTLLIC
jgi:hypothetical protein